MNNRHIGLDLLRIFSSIMIIGIHSFDLLDGTSPTVSKLLYELVWLGLPSFFLLSSCMLDSKNDYAAHLPKYYLDKFIRICIPLYAFSVVYYVYNTEGKYSLFHISNYFRGIIPGIKATITESQHFHLWYVYTLFGLYLLVPFLKKMLKSLTYSQLSFFVGLCFIINIIKTFNIPIGIDAFAFTSWIIYYFIGYWILQESSRKFDLFIIVAGIISYVASVFISRDYPDSVFAANIYSTSPLMMLCTSALFISFYRLGKCITLKDSIQTFIKFISARTYVVYLAHPLAIYAFAGIIKDILPESPLVPRFFIYIILIFIISTIVATVFDFIVYGVPKKIISLVHKKKI